MESKGGDTAIKLFTKAVENAKPLLEVKSRRVGGANIRCRSKLMPTAVLRWRSAG